MNEAETWDNWREHVLAEIKRTNDNYVILNNLIFNLQLEIAKLQVKSGIWGAVGGIIPILILVSVEKLK